MSTQGLEVGGVAMSAHCLGTEPHGQKESGSVYSLCFLKGNATHQYLLGGFAVIALVLFLFNFLNICLTFICVCVYQSTAPIEVRRDI